MIFTTNVTYKVFFRQKLYIPILDSKMGMEIQKDELIQFHVFLFHVRNHLECVEKNYDPDVFSSYDALNTTPYHVNRSKDEHKVAVFELCKGISKMVMIDDPSTISSVNSGNF